MYLKSLKLVNENQNTSEKWAEIRDGLAIFLHQFVHFLTACNEMTFIVYTLHFR